MSRRLNLNLLVYRKPVRCLNKTTTAIAIYFLRGDDAHEPALAIRPSCSAEAGCVS